MRLASKYITICAGGFAILLLSLTPSQSVAQTHSLRQTMEAAEKQGIPEQDLNNLTRRAHEKNISDEQISGMLQTAVDMASQNLPYKLVIQKCMEGLAKGVNPSIIMSVEAKMYTNTREAAQMTDQWMSKPSVHNMIIRSGNIQTGTFRTQVVTMTARTLFQGVKDKDLKQLFSEMTQSSVTAHMTPGQVSAAIEILPDLPTTRNRPDISRSLVMQAIKKGLTPDQIGQLPMALARAQQMGQLPAEAIASRLSKALERRNFTMAMLQGLFGDNSKEGPSGGIPPGLNNPHAGEASHANDHGMNHDNSHGENH